jgi:sodium:sulfate symporter-like transmembrane protein
MVAAETASASASAENLLENPNAPLVIVGQILCILVPVAVWFAPLPLEPVTKHGFAIVGFMVVAWITRAMDYALAGFVGCFLFWALGVVRFPVAFSGFANDTAWFLFGALLLGVIATRSGVARRLAYFIMLRVGIWSDSDRFPPDLHRAFRHCSRRDHGIHRCWSCRGIQIRRRKQRIARHVSDPQLHGQCLRQDDHRGRRCDHGAGTH